MIAAVSNACLHPVHPAAHVNWLTGDYLVTPVTQAFQARMIQRLDGRLLRAVSYSFAKRIASAPIPSRKHYYLTSVAWFSDAATGTIPGRWVATKVDVDSNHIAYLTSFLLTHSGNTSEYAAILTSSIPLRGVVQHCEAAE